MANGVFTVKIAGPAGAGIKSGGLLLSNILVKHGLKIRDYSEYPSLIRGGHNTYQVSFSSTDIFTSHYHVDLFFSLSPGHWESHIKEFSPETLIFVDDDTHLNLPLKNLCQDLGGNIYANTICLGVSAYILKLNLELCRQMVSEQFGADSPNNRAFDAGYEIAQKTYPDKQFPVVFPETVASNIGIYDGNESFGWGFIKGGGNFYAAYPMTPATGTLHFLAAKQDEYHLTVVHPEDEIAAASMVCGAAFAGSRSATGTSGGGFALMVESISFAGAANIGAVFYLVSRPGPATGLPTWTSQGDLLFAVNAGHGEFNKVVLAPGDQQDSFELSAEALNLAARFNIPVIVLSDKFISESSASLPDLSLLKPEIVKSILPIPGTPELEFLANSYEHDESGFSTEDAEVIKKMVDKRVSLKKNIYASLPKPFVSGNSQAKKLIISWGSTKSTILEALKLLPNKDDFAMLHLRSVWPIVPELGNIIKPFTETILIENNATAQLGTLLKSQFDFIPAKTILKYDGRPFFPEELVNLLSTN
jgi:2-oxoglutarate/2-oxoacid ferredoxin oxidoreductase subunit alpha